MTSRFVIEQEFGIYHVGGRGSGHSGSTLEKALAKAAPDAPANYVQHAAEVLESLFQRTGSGWIHEGVLGA